MATNKKAVMVYLPEDLESFVSGYCLANGITIEKDGETSPRMGTGIVRLLESLSKSESTTTGKSLGHSRDKVKDLETAIADLRSEIESVKLESPPMPSYELSKSEIKEMINESIALAMANATKPKDKKSQSDYLAEGHANGWLTTTELESHLKCGQGVLSRQKNVIEWTSKRDPDGIAWDKADNLGKYQFWQRIENAL